MTVSGFVRLLHSATLRKELCQVMLTNLWMKHGPHGGGDDRMILHRNIA